MREHGKIFQGGNAQYLHKLLRVTSGDAILYTGDHIYADTIRSKRSLGWRTCLIVPELTKEIQISQSLIHQRDTLLDRRKQQYLLENENDRIFVRKMELTKELRQLQALEKNETAEGGHSQVFFSQFSVAVKALERQIDELTNKSVALTSQIQEIRNDMYERLNRYHSAFHPKWGQVS